MSDLTALVFDLASCATCGAFDLMNAAIASLQLASAIRLGAGEQRRRPRFRQSALVY
jgi:hypothetical protein